MVVVLFNNSGNFLCSNPLNGHPRSSSCFGSRLCQVYSYLFSLSADSDRVYLVVSLWVRQDDNSSLSVCQLQGFFFSLVSSPPFVPIPLPVTCIRKGHRSIVPPLVGLNLFVLSSFPSLSSFFRSRPEVRSDLLVRSIRMRVGAVVTSITVNSFPSVVPIFSCPSGLV